MIEWNHKDALHFYTGSGVGGRLTQADYMVILEGVIAKDWREDWVLVEDNDNAHGTRGKADNKVKQLKRQLGIKSEANCPE